MSAVFGTWTDGTSDLIYRGAMGYILDGLHIGPVVVDLGGANGLSRAFLGDGHQVTTVDIDPAAGADVTADALTYRHPVPADTVLMRYVLHYLPGVAVHGLLAHLARWHAGNVVVVQFANEDPGVKAASSADSPGRTWRTPATLLDLLASAPGWRPGGRVNRLDYTVRPEFYANRLGVPGRVPHPEALLGLELERA